MTWLTREQRDGPFLRPLRAQFTELSDAFPSLDELNRRLDALRPRPASAGGAPLRFVAQRGRVADYERRVFERGEIATRPDNLHDLFNALSWLVYPLSKIALNREHLRAPGGGRGGRGARRDLLTLLDESGAVIVCRDERVKTLLNDFQWQTLFVERRAATAAQLDCFLFGHGLLVKTLTPYVGLTAKTVVIDPPAGFAAAGPARQTALVDRALALRLGAPDRLRAPRELQPLPLLGLPGWWPANEDPAFYRQTDYFRPGRRKL